MKDHNVLRILTAVVCVLLIIAGGLLLKVPEKVQNIEVEKAVLQAENKDLKAELFMYKLSVNFILTPKEKALVKEQRKQWKQLQGLK